MVYIGSAIAFKIVATKTQLETTEGTVRDTIVVSGEGKVDAKPDVAFVTLGVNKESLNIVTAQNENTKIMNKIAEFAKGLGIKSKDLKTTNYSLYPRYEYNSNTGRQSLAAYVVSQNLEVKIRNFDNIGKLIEEATNLGMNEMSNLSFILDNEAAATSEVRAEAIQDAKEKARVLARQLGVRLGDIISFYESGPMPIYSYSIGGGGAMMEKANAPQIEPGTNQISTTVSLTYEIIN